jgi:hypothetical protein
LDAARSLNDSNANQLAQLLKDREANQIAMSRNQDSIKRFEFSLRMSREGKEREAAGKERDIASRDLTIAGLKSAFELEKQWREQAEVRLCELETRSTERELLHQYQSYYSLTAASTQAALDDNSKSRIAQLGYVSQTMHAMATEYGKLAASSVPRSIYQLTKLRSLQLELLVGKLKAEVAQQKFELNELEGLLTQSSHERAALARELGDTYISIMALLRSKEDSQHSTLSSLILLNDIVSLYQGFVRIPHPSYSIGDRNSDATGVWYSHEFSHLLPALVQLNRLCDMKNRENRIVIPYAHRLQVEISSLRSRLETAQKTSGVLRVQLRRFITEEEKLKVNQRKVASRRKVDLNEALKYLNCAVKHVTLCEDELEKDFKM